MLAGLLSLLANTAMANRLGFSLATFYGRSGAGADLRGREENVKERKGEYVTRVPAGRAKRKACDARPRPFQPPAKRSRAGGERCLVGVQLVMDCPLLQDILMRVGAVKRLQHSTHYIRHSRGATDNNSNSVKLGAVLPSQSTNSLQTNLAQSSLRPRREPARQIENEDIIISNSPLTIPNCDKYSFSCSNSSDFELSESDIDPGGENSGHEETLRKKLRVNVARLHLTADQLAGAKQAVLVAVQLVLDCPPLQERLVVRRGVVRRVAHSTRYIKPSRSRDNYGLGGRQEMLWDDPELPRREVPDWARAGRGLLHQLAVQASTPPDWVWGDCGSVDLAAMFPESAARRDILRTPPSSGSSRHPPRLSLVNLNTVATNLAANKL